MWAARRSWSPACRQRIRAGEESGSTRRFRSRFRRQCPPVHGAGGADHLYDPVAVAVISVGRPARRSQPVLGVVGVGCGTVAGHIAGGIVAESWELIADAGGRGLQVLRVRLARQSIHVGQVAPGVNHVVRTPECAGGES
jgi:hypothetical protein